MPAPSTDLERSCQAPFFVSKETGLDLEVLIPYWSLCPAAICYSIHQNFADAWISEILALQKYLSIIAETWVMICKISIILNICNLYLHNLCLDIHSFDRKLSKCITCSTFSDFWWNVKWLLFTHLDTFQVEGKLYLTNINWIIKRAINLNPTCVDKIMVMEACLHLSTSYLPRNLIRDFGILASREVKSGQRWPSTRLHRIHTAYSLM